MRLDDCLFRQRGDALENGQQGKKAGADHPIGGLLCGTVSFTVVDRVKTFGAVAAEIFVPTVNMTFAGNGICREEIFLKAALSRLLHGGRNGENAPQPIAGKVFCFPHLQADPRGKGRDLLIECLVLGAGGRKLLLKICLRLFRVCQHVCPTEGCLIAVLDDILRLHNGMAVQRLFEICGKFHGTLPFCEVFFSVQYSICSR